MEIKDKIIVVTGAGSGIGKALVEKFIAEGAKTVVGVDINADTAKKTAAELGCVAMSADVAKEDDVRRVIEDTENTIGPIDLFCSNAGVAAGASEQSANAEWELCWNVNVMSHVYAARFPGRACSSAVTAIFSTQRLPPACSIRSVEPRTVSPNMPPWAFPSGWH